MARVTSSLWVAAYIRRQAIAGASALLMRRGAEEAGAIFVIVDRLDGRLDLYGPAPQSEVGEDAPDRLFQRLAESVSETAVREKLDREMRFDPDVWIVAVEDRAGSHRLELV